MGGIMQDVFSEEIQFKMLCLLKDKNFLLKNYSLFKPYYFTNPIYIDICRVIVEYVANYKIEPSWEVVFNELKKMNFDNRPPLEQYVETLELMKQQSLREIQYLKQEFEKFVLSQEMKRAIHVSIDWLKSGELDKVKHTWSKIIRTTIDRKSGTDYFDLNNIINRIEYEDDTKKIPTGLPDLDEALGGGLGVGELGIIMAGTNVGKSSLLVMFGAGALRHRKKVVHFSFEMSERKIAQRYDRNLLGKSYLAIKETKQESIKALLKFKELLGCNLYIREYPTRTASVLDITAELDSLRAEDFESDLVIVDYASIMKPVRNREARWIEIEETVEMLRGLANEFCVPVWTAAQTRQNALGKKTPTLEDLGESFGQAKIADVVLIICQDETEYKEGRIRIVVAKNRDNKKLQTFHYFIDYETMRLLK